MADQEAKNKDMENELKKFLSQVVLLQEGFKKLQNDYAALVDRLKIRTKELEKSEGDKAVLEKALLDSRSIIQKANELGNQTQFFLDKITEGENEKLELVKKVTELEGRLETSDEAMKFVNERLPLLTSTIDKYQDQIQTLRTENDALKEGSNFDKEVFELREELQRTINANNKQTKSLKDELELKEKEAKALRDKLNQYETKGKDEDNNLTCNEETCKLHFKEHLNKKLKVYKSKEIILNNQIEQLKALVLNYEESNKKLVEYINNFTTKPVQETSESLVEELKSELRIKNNELNLLGMDKAKLQSEMNIFKLELGAKIAECETKNAEITRLTEDNIILNEKLNQDENVINSQILSRDNEIINLKEKLEIALTELKVTKDLLLNRTKECEDFRAQLQSLPIEVNNEDLMQSYKVVCDSNQRQKEEIEALRVENKNLIAQIQALHRRIAILEGNNRKMLTELETQTNQMKNLIDELQEAYKFIKILDAEKNSQAEESKNVLY